MLSPHLVISLWTGPPITFQVACLFVFGCVFGLLCVLVLFCCVLCGCVFLLCFSLDCDGCWTMYRSITSPLLWLPSFDGGSLVCIN